MKQLKPLIKSFMGFAQENLGFQNPPKLFFKQDVENAKDILGKTAHYNPQNQSVTVFVTNRHPKDILRSLAHELVHHVQNLRGDLSFEKCGEMGTGYAQTNPHLREMEREAFERGSLCFRDWCDEYKKQLQEVKFLKESKKMANKLTKNKLKGLIRNVLKEMKLKEEVYDPPPMLPSRGDTGRTPFDVDRGLYPKLEKAAKDQTRFLKRVGFPNIKSLQKAVRAEESGEYDKQTYDAIKKFQEKIGLHGDAVDGVFGPGTLRQLRAKKRPQSKRRARDEREMDKRTFKEPAKPIANTDSLAKIAGVDPGLIKKNKTFPSGFQDDPLASDEENADRYDKFTKEKETFEESKNPLSEIMGCGGKGKRDEEVVLDEMGGCPACGQSPCVCPMEEGMDCPHCDRGAPREECTCGTMEEAKDQNKDGKNDFADVKIARMKASGMSHEEATKKAESTSESKIYTPEQEQIVYESRFNNRNEQIFDKLKKLWTK